MMHSPSYLFQRRCFVQSEASQLPRQPVEFWPNYESCLPMLYGPDINNVSPVICVAATLSCNDDNSLTCKPYICHAASNASAPRREESGKPRRRRGPKVTSAVESLTGKAGQVNIATSADVRIAVQALIGLAQNANRQRATISDDVKQQVSQAAQKLALGLEGTVAPIPPSDRNDTTAPSQQPAQALANLDNNMLEGLCDNMRFIARIPGVDIASLCSQAVALAAQRFTATPPTTAVMGWNRWNRIMNTAALGGMHYTKDEVLRQSAPVMVRQLLGVGMNTANSVIPGRVWSALVKDMGRTGVPAAVADPLFDAIVPNAPACKTVHETWVYVSEGMAGMGSKNPQMVGICVAGAVKCIQEESSVRLKHFAPTLHFLVRAGATREQLQPLVAAVSAAVKAGKADLTTAAVGDVSREQVVADLKALGIKDEAMEGALVGGVSSSVNA